MGITRQKNGDNSIVFHVGKYLPPEGSSVLLVPGVQNAQGRGVYCSDKAQLKYAGGEHYKIKVETIPIYCIPMLGPWMAATLKKKDNLKVLHTNERVISLNNLQYTEQIDGEKILRYYWSLDVSFFREPQTKVFDEFSKSVRDGKISCEEAIRLLREKYKAPEIKAEASIIIQKLKEAEAEGKIPHMNEIEKFGERASELNSTQEIERRMLGGYR